MSRASTGEVGALLDQARAVYDDDPVSAAAIDAYRRRLAEPLRLAVAGMVKAGKSTILNALLGEQVAPTDAGECTRIVTWYRHSRSARITVRLRGGGETLLPVRRSKGALVLDLGRLTAEEVDSILVEWPAESLRSTVLIDTPGIASISEDVSARTLRFLTPEQAPSHADAILYLLRHIHASDVAFLEAFRDTAAGASQTVNAVALLSRADEIGSGRIDSLLSAATIADRYRRDGELRALALGCIPVAGLLAEGARTLREDEFVAFRALADLDRTVRDRMLISVDRFCRPHDDISLTVAERQALLARFGIFGVRLGAALVRAGARTSSELAERMVQQSGLIEVQRFVTDQFRSRASALKARGVLQGLDDLIRADPRQGTGPILAGIERVTARNHALREMSFLARMRTTETALTAEDAAEAERIVGGDGTDARVRLGLARSATSGQARERVGEILAHWRALSESPLTDRATARSCAVVIRSVEGIASELAPGGQDRPSTDVVSAGRPAQRGG